MKNLKKILVASSLLLVGVLIAYACSKDETENQKIENSDSGYHMRSLDSNSLSFEISDGLYKLIFTSNTKDKISFSSELTVFYDNDSLFTTHYAFKTDEEHWKLMQAPVIIEKSTILKSKKIPESILSDVSTLLTDNIGHVFHETLESKNRLVVSSINYHISIINSVLRAYATDTDCGCTVHPEFLLDKIFFNCQEEHFYETKLLMAILDDYSKENPVDVSTNKLMDFLKTYNKETIRFDDYYSFYVNKQDFDLFVTNTLKTASRDCSWWCPLGCGSSHGCCGNYSGCCLYSHILCYVHDAMCTNCKPKKFCLRGCKPDKPSTSLKSIE